MRKAVRFFRKITAGIRPLPDFLIIGAAKCGTTSLHNYLMGHPCIAPAFQKEVHFFDANFHKGVSWYRAQFPIRVHARSGKARRAAGLLTGESSPYYIFHPPSPARIAATLPRAKLIALLRNPVDRAYSHYHHQVRKGLEPLPFEEAIASESERLNGDPEKRLLMGSYESVNYRRYSYLARGLYADQLDCWIAMFPRKQLLILTTDELEHDPGKVLSQTLRFLNVREWEPKRFPRYNTASYPPMSPAMRERLIAYFEPHNRRLETMLGRQLKWDR
jgi:hypothetical protein